MSNMKILIVEDEPSYALELQMIVDELEYDVLATVDNAKSVFKVLEKEQPDLILMDINIKGEVNGIEVARRIEEKGIGIIFITSFDDRTTFQEASTTRNFGYIVKPFNHLTLQSAIEISLRNTTSDDEAENDTAKKEGEGAVWDEDIILKDFVFIKKRNRLEKVALEDIEYLEADGNYCMILAKQKKFILKMSLKKASDILSTGAFLRVSKSHIVNMNNISTIVLSENRILLGEKSFVIGKSYKSKVMSRLKLLV